MVLPSAGFSCPFQIAYPGIRSLGKMEALSNAFSNV
jgi:hypothetical protein